MRALGPLSRYPRPLLLLLALGMTLAVYLRLPRVYFFGDDYIHMLTIANRGALYFLVQPWGGHMLFTRNAVFILTYELFGMHAAPFGWLALLTHCANVVLLFRITLAVTDRAELAAFAAALWGTSPLQEGTLGWYSVYGHALAASCLLVVLDLATKRLKAGLPIPRRACILWAALLLVGSSCFGVGVAIALVSPFVTRLLVPKAPKQPAIRFVFALLPVAVVALYCAWLGAYARFAGVPGSEDSMYRQSLGDISPAISMFGYLVAAGASGLIRGFAFAPEAMHLAPPVAWWAVAGCAALFVGACVIAETDDKRRIVAFALLAVAPYALIALGRANFYRSLQIPVEETARLGRYHYVATLPLSILLALGIGQAARFRALRRLPLVVLVAWVGFSAFSFRTSPWHLDEHSDCRDHVALAFRRIEQAVDAQIPGADVLIPNPPLPDYFNLLRGYADLPGTAALYAAAYPSDLLRGRRVRFVEEPGKRGMFAHPKNRRLSKLLVSAP